MKQNSSYVVEIPADIRYVPCTVEQLLSFLQENVEVDEDSLFDLKLILNELIINAVNHGNKGDQSKKVLVKVGICTNNKVYIIVEDEGQGYKTVSNPCNMDLCNEESETDVFLLDEKGRGLKLVASLCNNIRVSSKGNKVVILKEIMCSTQ